MAPRKGNPTPRYRHPARSGEPSAAYRSDKSGRTEVYVQPCPLEQGTERVISTGGGSQPRWGSGGGELFYVAFDEQLMAVPPDGRRFLMATIPENPDTPPIDIVLNWNK